MSIPDGSPPQPIAISLQEYADLELTGKISNLNSRLAFRSSGIQIDIRRD